MEPPSPTIIGSLGVACLPPFLSLSRVPVPLPVLCPTMWAGRLVCAAVVVVRRGIGTGIPRMHARVLQVCLRLLVS